MSRRNLKSYSAKPGEAGGDWYVMNLTDQILGRAATRIATILMGKHKPTYTPHVDTGDFIIVTHADKVRVTGSKADTMKYARYSYHPGGYREVPYKRVMQDHPDRIVREAVRRMLPKNALGRRMLSKLKIYASDGHPHAAQQPVSLSL